MSNVLSEEKKQQIIALGKLGWSLRRIERFTGVRRETAGAYLKAAGIIVHLPGTGRRQALAKPAIEVTPDFSAAKPANNGVVPNLPEAKPATVTPDLAAPLSENQGSSGDTAPSSASTCEPYRELIDQGLCRGRNAKAIWQDLVSDHGFAGSYQTVKRFVRKIRGSQLPQAVGIILTAVGEEAQVDYGSGPMVRDSQSGKYRRTRLFVLTLGFSRKSVRLLTWRSSVRIWAELHEKAFRRLGGCVRVVVLDNLREGVLVPDIYDPTLNPLYRDVLAHYGVVALPCRIKDPDRKGKVESGIGHTQKTPLKGMRFESLEEAQAYLDRWEERWADTRIHGTTKRQVAVMFAEEKPHLLPLPLEPFRYYQYGERVVHLDGCVEVEAAYYSLPPGWIGRSVKVQWDELHVRILHPNTNQLLREHLRQKRGGYRIREEDHPKKMPLSTAQLLRRTEHAGTQIGKLCQLIYQRQAEQSLFEAAFQPGFYTYVKSNFMDHISDEAIELMSESAQSRPSRRTFAPFVEHWHGAAARVGVSETAFAHRKHQFNYVLWSIWENPADSDTNIEWTRRHWQSMLPYLASGAYVNYAMEEDDAFARTAYGPNYDRLVALKNKYDPTNFFRMNHNIKPTTTAQTAIR